MDPSAAVGTLPDLGGVGNPWNWKFSFRSSAEESASESVKQ